MQRARYRRILIFFARILVSLVIWELVLPWIGLHAWSQRTRARRYRKIGAQFRVLAIRIGGVMIKVGQFLSARLDVLPAEITQELADLQDEVPAEVFSAIRALIEAEFGVQLETKFLQFNPLPIAAASLGQVHAARIANRAEQDQAEASDSAGLEVVVKVQRPGIERLIAIDLAALRTVGGWLKRYPPISQRADIDALLAEFTRILNEEIDYIAEGQHAETFAKNFNDRAGIRVPAVLWSHTTRRVLALQDVRGIKITDYAAITAAGIARAEVAKRLFRTYLQQIFEDHFFHADPHPGNLFVSLVEHLEQLDTDEESQAGQPSWVLTFVDFGMVGQVPSRLQAGMREMMVAIGTRDPARLVKSYQMLGVLLPGANLNLLEQAESRFFERFWGKSMSELTRMSREDVRQIANEFRDLMYNLPFQVPEDLILLGRTLGILSGMCTGLDPNFNFWEAMSPYAQKLVTAESAGSLQAWFGLLADLARTLLATPQRLESFLERAERGELSVQDPQLQEKVARVELALNRVAAGIIFAALLLGGLQVYLADKPEIASLLLAGAVISLGWILLSGRKQK
ncbi:MAG TPA: AarF/UbiB family protein [Anaerolineales bacterium]|nr:AarF/UbiB family protein [Anaerolineales bacterium]